MKFDLQTCYLPFPPYWNRKEQYICTEDYLQAQGAWEVEVNSIPAPSNLEMTLANLRKQVSDVAGQPMIVSRHSDAEAMSFVIRTDLNKIANQGPATPDHVIRTKRLPLVGRDIDAYINKYQNYFNENEPLANERKTILDSAPRVILDPELGMCTIGRSIKDRICACLFLAHFTCTFGCKRSRGGKHEHDC